MIDDLLTIINACLSGRDAAGWDLFFNEFAGIAMNILNGRFLSFSVDEKEDVIHNTFLKLLRGGLKNFQGSTGYEFLAYFKRIVMNEAHTYLESGKKWSDTVSLDQERDYHEERLPPFEVCDRGPGPEASAERNELLQIINSVLRGCPLEAQQLFLMKVDGYKDREIADILGISMGTVASKYSRIRERMRQLLGE
jgi:RNA polymerase sigma-70 factor (ECF subfamily)